VSVSSGSLQRGLAMAQCTSTVLYYINHWYTAASSSPNKPCKSDCC